MNYEYIQKSVFKDLEQVNKLIKSSLKSNILLIEEVSKHIVGAPSKRIRPLLVIIIGKMLRIPNKKIYQLALIIEFIHTATLLHDDVVDISEKRRGKKSANKIWGNEASVLVGDYLYSRSFQMMVKLGDKKIFSILADATNQIAKGEVMQLMNVGKLNTTLDQYMKVINYKTATLFEASTRSSAILAKKNEKNINKFGDYGKHLGLAFQISDDILDFTAKNSNQIGKNIGDDLEGGKITLPVIYGYKFSNSSDRKKIKRILKSKSKASFNELKDILIKTGAIDMSIKKANYHATFARKSISYLKHDNYKDLLLKLADFSISRKK